MKGHSGVVGNELADYKAKEGGNGRKGSRPPKPSHPGRYQTRVQDKLENRTGSDMRQGGAQRTHILYIHRSGELLGTSAWVKRVFWRGVLKEEGRC